MWNYIWPVLLIVLSNVAYNISTKSTPGSASPFLSLTITYLAGAALTFFAYLFIVQEKNILVDMKQLNWTSLALGLAIVGLETGYIFLYRAGWNISTGSLVANILLAIALIGIGFFYYKEPVGLKQVVGILFCITGLVLIFK